MAPDSESKPPRRSWLEVTDDDPYHDTKVIAVVGTVLCVLLFAVIGLNALVQVVAHFSRIGAIVVTCIMLAVLALLFYVVGLRVWIDLIRPIGRWWRKRRNRDNEN